MENNWDPNIKAIVYETFEIEGLQSIWEPWRLNQPLSRLAMLGQIGTLDCIAFEGYGIARPYQKVGISLKGALRYKLSSREEWAVLAKIGKIHLSLRQF
jgi:hypothetical protein